METLIALFGILGALLIGAINPGPSFVLVARTAIAVSRRDGLATALGMGIGALIFGSLTLLLSSEHPLAGYLRAKTSIDRMAGAVMGALGI